MRGLVLPFVLAAACTTAPAVETVAPGETVTLRVTESARIEPPGLTVEFAAVVADSRCPAGVTCVWEGDAEIALRVVADDGSSGDLRLHTSAQSRAATFAGVRFTLVELEPLPLAGSTPRQVDYRAKIAVGQ